MPPRSEEQKRLMCMALAIKLGKLPAKRYPRAAKVARQMTVEQLKEYCEAPITKALKEV